MKNKKTSFKILSFLTSVILTALMIAGQTVTAASPSQNDSSFSLLSNAMNVIRGNIELKKSALLNNDITFTAEEFERILGVKKLSHISVTQLPSVSEGVLVLGGVEVLTDQTISRENIKYLRLVPYPDRIGTIKFYFKNISDKTEENAILCTVSVTQTLQFAPSAYPSNITTQKNIAVFSSMDGVEPDKSKEISYKIIRVPKKGVLSINDVSNGHFVYKPNSNFTGTDSFIYQVEDEYGNLSNQATVEIKVTKAAANVVFNDMKNHWAHNSAIKATAYGIIDEANNSHKLSELNELNFNPNLLMSRVEFLEMTMKAAKLDKNLEETYNTGFADDTEIPLKYKSYVKRAKELGIIQGIVTETGVYFDPNSVITRSEAAVIINNILKAPVNNLSRATTKARFVDAVAIPQWAEKDITALNLCGIIKGDENGNMNPYGLMNKAQSAEMLCAMVDYQNNQKKPFNLLSWLFK